MAGIKNYTADEALSLAVNDGADALKVDLEGANINATVDVQLSSANDSVECIQDTPADLKATVTQASTARTITGTATVTPVAASASVLTADGQVKGSAGTVYSIMVSMNGVTAGDKVEIKNSTDNSGSALLSFVATAAAQSFMFNPSVGVSYSAGIYADVSLTGGTVSVTTVYA